MNARVFALRSLTEPNVPRRMANGLTLDDAEPDLDEVEPGRRGRGEVHAHARVGLQPASHLDAFVCRVMVHHQVQLTVGAGPGNLHEEAQELVVAMPRLAAGGNLAGSDLQRRKQGRRAV